MVVAVLECNWGSDVEFDFVWPNTEGEAANLTGWTVSVIDAHDLLGTNATATFKDAENGVVTVRVEWSDTYPKNVDLPFRVQISQGTQHDATNSIRVLYS